MRHLNLIYILIGLVILSCSHEKDPYNVGKQHIGLLNDSTKVKDLEIVFNKDSVSKFSSSDEFSSNINTIEIFEKNGNRLLVLTPETGMDSTSVIESVQIVDPRYKTDKNISINSTFKDISEAYKISRIDNLINSVVVFVNEINAAFTIDKKELPANLRFDRDIKIEEANIPDNAKIKYFFLNWNYK